ncbi:MAG: GTPase HflX [Oscillospiraceae bacterium]|nr:GTPase HflX [Oscillospiraceae bacterium]
MLAGLAAASMNRDQRSTDESLEELEALLETAGGVSCGVVLQSREKPDPRTFLGKGKVEEMKAIIEAENCDLAVVDNELSPSQMRALGEALGVRVVDRSGLIMDIFAQRAQTREGKLQVELAQYKYLLPRLTGMWQHLVSQTGTSAPIGTRGPGETQLETDRRHIRRKIQKLEEELEQVRRVRSTQRRQREKNAVPVVALVGYTNAGKSTLLNRLTDADTQTGDRLFDTLDTTTRRLRLDEVGEILLSDTVGFIQRLPHHLVEAFKATLEELCYADLLLHVIDASNPGWEEQMTVVNKLIRELGAEETPRLEVFNKSDIHTGEILPRSDDILRISAATGEGCDTLVRKIAEILLAQSKRVTLHIPYSDARIIDRIYKDGEILERQDLDDHIALTAIVSERLHGQIAAYIV